MPRKHFHSVRIEVISSMFDAYMVGPDYSNHSAKRERFLEPHKKVLRARGLLGYISLALMSAKVVTVDPRITELHINLTNDPRKEPEYYRKGERWDLIVDIYCPVAEILAVPLDDQSLGEFFIKLIERALSQAVDYSELPRDVILAGCERFRKSAYIYPYIIGEETIKGTKLKGRLQAKAGCVSTDRIFMALYRGKPIFQTEMSGVDGADFGLRTQFGGFTWQDDEIIVDIPYWLQERPVDLRNLEYVKPSRIDLHAFPEARDFIRTKCADTI
ncbi:MULTISPECIES: hypothetical protein [unclassified Yoonia]|uniref:hypothetical protein n=1 Tax=unclassified Yoonia TaxID=2629118 RepID=UPI002B00087D|nr:MULTISPECIES: hypothetical protein [unclassified Yoonia]